MQLSLVRVETSAFGVNQLIFFDWPFFNRRFTDAVNQIAPGRKIWTDRVVQVERWWNGGLGKATQRSARGVEGEDIFDFHGSFFGFFLHPYKSHGGRRPQQISELFTVARRAVSGALVQASVT